MKNPIIILLALLPLLRADIYMHHPRGSNNRCDERSNDAQNQNRLFDSENNSAGGYAWCPKEMVYYEGTEIPIQWTAQHGCGNGQNSKGNPSNPEQQQCQYIIQLGCEDTLGREHMIPVPNYALTDGVAVPSTVGSTCVNTRPLTENCKPENSDPICATLNLNNGGDLNTFNSDLCRCHPRKMATYAQHESELYYKKCQTRSRNKGLFLATQNLNGNSAIYTRQTANGNRHGYECGEERDYYPYWHPTPYRDIAVVTSDTQRCTFYKQESQNVMPKGECLSPTNPNDPTYWEKNNQKDCEAILPVAGRWVMQPAHNMTAPDCIQAEYLMDNHLGQTAPSVGDGDPKKAGKLTSYIWKVAKDVIPQGQTELKCYFRLRYNISNADVKWDFSAADNGKIKQNPVIRIGDSGTDNANESLPLRLAINTAQFGRTFEDRSQVFIIKKRPQELEGATIHNFNVRGKRGNIAQVRNCVEYDYVPKVLNAKVGDYIHFQWCGSDYNPNGNAGEGRDGTDRSNVVPVVTQDSNLMLPIQNVTMFTKEDLVSLAWIDQQDCYNTTEMLGEKKNEDQDLKSCHFLNGAPSPYYSRLVQVKEAGVLHVMSSRNNNFSNRSQRGTLIIENAISEQVVAGLASAGGILAVGGIAAGVIYYMKRNGAGGRSNYAFSRFWGSSNKI